MDSRLNKPIAILAVIVALVLGVVVGKTTGIADRIFGGPSAKTIASSSLESMRAQNRLVAFVARYVSVTTTETSRFGFSAKRTLILPGDVRYELDLAQLGPEDVKWDAATKTLSVTLPEIELAGPEVDLAAAREYGENGVLSVVTDADSALDRNNRARAVADLRKQAGAAVPMRLAREAGRQAVERSFALPLQAAGFGDARVVARYPTEGSPVTVPLDHSRSYNEVLEEAARDGR